jgi:peroxiredoxin
MNNQLFWRYFSGVKKKMFYPNWSFKMKIIISVLLIFLIVSNISAQDQLDFSAETLSGNRIQLSELRTKGPVLVTFWALWCKPCRNELKILQKMFKNYNSDGFQIVAVNEDTPRSLAKVESFVKSQGLDFHIVLDPNKDLFEQFNGQAIPLAILYDKSGNVVYQNVGYLPGDEVKLEEELKKLLKGS